VKKLIEGNSSGPISGIFRHFTGLKGENKRLLHNSWSTVNIYKPGM
jgi:hypothetical protein